MELHVKTLTGATRTISVDHNATVYNAKLCIEKQCAWYNTNPFIKVEHQKLIYAGRYLQNEHTLAEYGITNDCTIHLIIMIPNKPESCDIAENEIENVTEIADLLVNNTYDMNSLPEIYRNRNHNNRKDIVFGYIKSIQHQINIQYIPDDIKKLCLRFYYIEGFITIMIMSLVGANQEFDIWPGYKIQTLKQIIQLYGIDSISHPYAQQRFIYKGRQLDDELCICNYEIQDGDKIHLLLRLQKTHSRPFDWEFWHMESDSSIESCSTEKNPSVVHDGGYQYQNMEEEYYQMFSRINWKRIPQQQDGDDFSMFACLLGAIRRATDNNPSCIRNKAEFVSVLKQVKEFITRGNCNWKANNFYDCYKEFIEGYLEDDEMEVANEQNSEMQATNQNLVVDGIEQKLDPQKEDCCKCVVL